MNKYFKIMTETGEIYYLAYCQNRHYGVILKVESVKEAYETASIGLWKTFYHSDSIDITDEKTINELDKLMVFQ